MVDLCGVFCDGRYRNRMEFKVQTCLYSSVQCVDIETEWNLKSGIRSCSRNITCRYRNRMEFKA